MCSAATSAQNRRVLVIRIFIVKASIANRRHRSKLENRRARMELKERQSPKAQVAFDALGIKTTCASPYAGAAAFVGTKSPPRKHYLHVRGRNKRFQQGMGSAPNSTQNARIFRRVIGV